MSWSSVLAGSIAPSFSILSRRSLFISQALSTLASSIRDCLYPARLDLDDPFVVSEVFCGHVSDDDSFFLKRCANGSDAARESPPPPADFLFFFAFLAFSFSA